MISLEEIEKAKNIKLSKHFTLWEFIRSSSFPDLVVYPSDDIITKLKVFAGYLEDFRFICAKSNPVTITSGWRNSALNANVGGTSNSVHKILDFDGSFLGVAADVVTTDILTAFKNTKLLKSPFKTFIYYPLRKFIHLDTRVSRTSKAWFISTTAGRYTPLTEKALEGLKYGTG